MLGGGGTPSIRVNQIEFEMALVLVLAASGALDAPVLIDATFAQNVQLN